MYINRLEIESNQKIYQTMNENYQKELHRFDEELRKIRKEDAKRWWEESTLNRAQEIRTNFLKPSLYRQDYKPQPVV